MLRGRAEDDYMECEIQTDLAARVEILYEWNGQLLNLV